MLQLEPGMMIWTWVTFVVLFFVLAKVAWKPLLSAVEKREKTIDDSLRKAEEARSEAQRLMDEQKKTLEETQNSIQEMLRENKEVAERMKNEIIDKAREEAEKLRLRAEADIERETEAAIIVLKKKISDLAIQAAGMLISDYLDTRKHRDLIDNYIKELDHLNKN